MSNLTRAMMMGAAGAASGSKTYVDDVFSTFLYDGSSSAQTITNGIDLSTEGGLVWLKSRTNAYNHALMDSERSWSGWLETNSNNPSQGGTYISANTDGFTFSSGSLFFNGDPYDYTSWTFRKAPGFFDICEWTGNSVSGRQIAHNLGSAPGFIMVKSYVAGTGGTGWMCYHRSLGNTKAIRMDNGSTATDASSAYWNNTDPTSTHFTVGNHEDINTTANSRSYVAYVFAHDSQVFGTDEDESIIKCGTYTGNASGSAGPVINLGFEPQWLMIKRSNSTGNWTIWDAMRGAGVPNQTVLEANQNTTEDVNAVYNIDFQSTGFQLKTSTVQFNGSTDTFIYIAIRRPHKPPTAGTEVFKPIADTATGAVRSITGAGFAPDLLFNVPRSNANLGTYVFDRIRGPGKSLRTLYASAGASQTNTVTSFDMDGITVGTDTGGLGINSFTYTSAKYLFRRASGFMDVVNYVGNGSAQNITHNLSAAPELIFVKSRTWIGGGNNNWKVYAEDIGNTDYLYLNSNAANLSNSNIWNDTSPTSTQFTVGTDSSASGVAFISYLFASRSGISKVGTYSGTGSDVNVDCGFTNGARLILLKRTNSTGDWYVFDSARGIVSGNDPYTLLNTAAAEVTNTDYIDPLASGFTVTSSAPDALNVSGGTYLFLAIA
jgi:hypothetical protein